MLLNISDITLNGNVRLGEEDIEDLARSMKTIGQITAIQVTLNPEDNSYHLLSGHRRLAAARSLGWSEIRVEEVEAENPLAVQLAENISRNELTPYEIAQGVLALKVEGLTQDKIADALGMAKAEISTFQKIAKGSEGIDPLTMNQLELVDLEFYAELHDMPPEMREQFVADHDNKNTDYWAMHKYVDEVKAWRWTQKKQNKALIKSLEDIGAIPMAYEERVTSKSLFGDQVVAHRGQPCHGYLINRSWDAEDGYAVFEYCMDPHSHAEAVDPETGDVDDTAKTLRRVAKDSEDKGISGTISSRQEQKARSKRKQQRKELVKIFADQKPVPVKKLTEMVFATFLNLQKPYKWQEIGKTFGLVKPVDEFHFDWDQYLSKFNSKDQLVQSLILAVGSVYISLDHTYSTHDNPLQAKLDELFGYKETTDEGGDTA